ncbi:MAG: hypothetical protein WCO66_05200 [Candidatus Absconditabacteria bacterium]
MVALLSDQKQIQKNKHENMFNSETMLPISEIKNDTVILKDGGIRAILKVSGLNLDLKNGDEQEIILEQYKKFLNGLDFPIQILARNSYLDLSNYINYMKENTTKIENLTLKKQAGDYVTFLEDIDLQQGLIYTKDFYIVVPYYQGEKDNQEINKGRVTKFLNVLNTKDDAERIVERYRNFLKGEKMLSTRCNVIMEGLGSMSIHVDRITTPDIISLLFRCYNPLLQGNQATEGV